MKRVPTAAAFIALIVYAASALDDHPGHSARLTVRTSPNMPVRIYLTRNGSPFRLHPVQAVLPIKVDVYYRDRLWLRDPDPEVFEAIHGDDSHFFLLKGLAHFSLPPGKYKLEAYRGFFYKPAAVEFELTNDSAREVTLPMETWADPAEWISSDDHIHLTRTKKDDSLYLQWLAAEDLNVGNFLELQRQVQAAPQYAYGKQGEAVLGSYSIRTGEEARNEFFGHTNLLGIRQAVLPMSSGTMYANSSESYPFYSIFDKARLVGGTVGHAHFYLPPQHSTVIMDALLGKIDFIETLQFGELKTANWYLLLNSGLRFAGIAGSDFPVPLGRTKPWQKWLPLLGPERTLVKSRAKSYAAWAEGVRAGRAMVTNGPLVALQIAGGRAVATAAFYRPIELLEIIRNGEVVASGKGGRAEASADCAQSCWFAARVRVEGGWVAHTNAEYILKDGRPVRVAADRARLAAIWDQEIAYWRGAGIRFASDAAGAEFWRLAEDVRKRLREE